MMYVYVSSNKCDFEGCHEVNRKYEIKRQYSHKNKPEANPGTSNKKGKKPATITNSTEFVN